MNDSRRRAFLDSLMRSDEIEVKKWEKKFLKSTSRTHDFSPKQRERIDELVSAYGAKVHW